MAVITPYSAQKSLINQLKDEKSTEATTKLGGPATKGVKPDVAGGPSAKVADTKLKELTVVSITESQGKLSLPLLYITYTITVFLCSFQAMNMDTSSCPQSGPSLRRKSGTMI